MASVAFCKTSDVTVYIWPLPGYGVLLSCRSKSSGSLMSTRRLKRIAGCVWRPAETKVKRENVTIHIYHLLSIGMFEDVRP